MEVSGNEVFALRVTSGGGRRCWNIGFIFM